MDTQEQDCLVQRLVRSGLPDEEIERTTGVSLLRLIELRGIAACGRPERDRRRPRSTGGDRIDLS